MKQLVVFIMLLVFATELKAQNCDALEMIKEGSTWEITSFNKRDKVEGVTVYYVTDVSAMGDAVIWKISMKMKDDKEEVYSETETEISCESGVFKMSMEQFINHEQMQGMQEMEVEVDASDIEYPTSPEVGETLPDAKVTVSAAMNGMTMMNMTTKVYDRKIESEESIETPAGTFDCLIISQKTSLENKLLSKEFSSKDWYLPGFGVVRSESYNKRGKLTGYTLLTKYEN